MAEKIRPDNGQFGEEQEIDFASIFPFDEGSFLEKILEPAVGMVKSDHLAVRQQGIISSPSCKLSVLVIRKQVKDVLFLHSQGREVKLAALSVPLHQTSCLVVPDQQETILRQLHQLLYLRFLELHWPSGDVVRHFALPCPED